MTSITLLLNSTDKVLTFAQSIGRYEESMDLEAGRSMIDAKSMLGIFSLNLKKPVILHIHAEGERADEIVGELTEYVYS
ncbi:MAG: HPr family phosphocarrier protein [Lachnospiraceae bacterium]|nr:HPr family phosphocarrier protein [Lachnospiraceae bacterium]